MSYINDGGYGLRSIKLKLAQAADRLSAVGWRLAVGWRFLCPIYLFRLSGFATCCVI